MHKIKNAIAKSWTVCHEIRAKAIEGEVETYGPQQDLIQQKLEAHVDDLKASNQDQVEMMERHSRDVILEAEEHLKKSVALRSQMLITKYENIRNILENQEQFGEDAFEKHYHELEVIRRQHMDDQCREFRIQVDQLEMQVQEAETQSEFIAKELEEGRVLAATYEANVKDVTREVKGYQGELKNLQSEIVGLQERNFHTKETLEEADRDAKNTEIDYNLLKNENSNLNDEVSRFGALVSNVEGNGQAASTSNGTDTLSDPALVGDANKRPRPDPDTPLTTNAKKRPRSNGSPS